MQVAILVGGLGTRLRGVVSGLPKAMAPVAGRPFLEHQVLGLKERGFTRILLLVGYLANPIIEYFGDGSSLGVEISYSKEPEQLGTAGALKNAEESLDETLLLLNGDTHLELDYDRFIGFHQKNRALITIALLQVEDASRYGSVGLDVDGKVMAFSEKSGGAPGLINGGAYVMERQVLASIEPARPISLEKEVIPALIGRSASVYGFVSGGRFIDIGTPDDYARADSYFTWRHDDGYIEGGQRGRN